MIMNQGNEQNLHIYFSTIFSFPLSKILVQFIPCKDKSKDGNWYKIGFHHHHHRSAAAQATTSFLHWIFKFSKLDLP